MAALLFYYFARPYARRLSVFLPLCAATEPAALHPAGLCLLAVALSGGLAAADMALIHIFLQHLAHLPGQRRVELSQPLGYILVHGGFADFKFAGGAAHCRARLENIVCNAQHSLLYISLHCSVPFYGVCRSYEARTFFMK